MAKEITLDSNLLIEYWKNQEKKEYIEELINLSKKGKIDLAITSRIEQDIPSPPLSQMINDLHLLGIQITGSVSRVGLWKLGTDKLGSRDFVKFIESINNT